MSNDDFFGKTSEMLNGLIDSIEKGIDDLKKEVKKETDKNDKNDRSDNLGGRSPFPLNPFKKDNKTASSEKKCEKECKAADIPASRIDTNDEVKIICELPGCARTDIKLDYVKDTLVVRAKKTAPVIGDDVTFNESDRFFGTLERRFRVGQVDAATIKAAFKDGLLTVTCSRPAEDKGVGITIE